MSIRVTILGCGGASGVPSIATGWGACDPANPRNRRRRPSILVETAGLKLLVDTSPDLREQLLEAEIRHLDAVLITHGHADHLHGLDDLREVNRAMGRSLDIWARSIDLKEMNERFAYCFSPLPAEAKSIFKPLLIQRTITPGQGFAVGEVPVFPFTQSHGWSETLGFRIGDFAYSTDVVDLDDAAFAVLAGLDTWIVDCFTTHPHATHAHVEKVLDWIARLRPRRAILTHMGPSLDYATLVGRLPEGVEPAHDGMVVEIS